jgi:hypothetical protein
MQRGPDWRCWKAVRIGATSPADLANQMHSEPLPPNQPFFWDRRLTASKPRTDLCIYLAGPLGGGTRLGSSLSGDRLFFHKREVSNSSTFQGIPASLLYIFKP